MSQWDLVSPEFAEVSIEADKAPVGVERVRAHEGALRLAQQHGSFAEEFVARMDLTQALYHVPRDPRNLTHFAWLRQALDPSRGLDQADRDGVLWRLKWAVDLVIDLPEVPLSSIVAAIDDIETVFRTDGYALRPVHAARARLARDTGDRATVDRELAAWLAAERDSRSDCEACERRDQAHLVADTDPERALTLIAPTVAGELTCGDEPRASLGLDAGLRVDRGDVDGAVSSFRRAWHLAADDPRGLGTVGDCLRVLLRLGNADRAVDLLVPRLSLADSLLTPGSRMWFAATAAHVLERAAAVGLAPESVDGRPTAEVAAELHREADAIAASFDARNGSSAVSDRLRAAHDDRAVPRGPTLPPTRLPDTEADVTASRRSRRVAVPAGLVERAALVRAALDTLDPDVDEHLRAWLRDREEVAATPTTPQEWSARAFLDRVSAQDVGGRERHRTRIAEALDAARRGDDDVEVARTEAELALLGDDEAGALAIADRLDADGHPGEAAGIWRRVAYFGAWDDPEELIRRAADGYGRAGQDRRRLLAEVEGAMATGRTDPTAAGARLDELEPEVADVPVLRVMVHDLRGRLARMAGDGEAAEAHLRAALAVDGAPERARVPVLLALCDTVVDREGYDDLELPAADVVAAATATRDPVLLAHGQRFLGLAYVETGRPAEAAELLEAALPVLREHTPGLVGPVGWALGNALVGLGQWKAARTAFATAAAGFEADERVTETGHAQWRAGNAAWDDDDTEAAAAHYDSAIEHSRAAQEVGLHVEALRSRAALRAATDDLAAGLADLDAAIPAGRTLAAEAGVGEDVWDGEVLEPHVLRQGAHLLAGKGEVDAAVERLSRAEALVGAEFELALHTEGAVILADHDRLEEAEARLRDVLPRLAAHAMDHQRVDAAGALARLLDRHGRGDEAEEVWAQYGPDA